MRKCYLLIEVDNMYSTDDNMYSTNLLLAHHIVHVAVEHNTAATSMHTVVRSAMR
jgi:hypothetical protein